MEYDILGRVKRQSVPTETNSSFTPTGDDAAGPLWTYQKYDWKGRVVRKINTDGIDQTTLNDSDILISYEGCGCAGGQVTTIQGENIIETDWEGNNPVTLGRRTQKVYEDILGRAFKTEVYDWNGTNVYSATVNSYNGRDQIANTRQYSGDTSSSTFRDVTMSYDGYGRMKTRHYPQENAGTNTTWAYNLDDSVNTATDPRGVVTNFEYYATTGLLHQITYDVPTGQTSTIPDTPDVSFVYDNLGNRTSMTDGTGSTSYSYNSLSQITSETKTFTGLSGSFPINYTYTLSGGVKSMTDPQNASRQANYGFDKTGRSLGAEIVSQGTTVGSVFDTKFRAWGGMKEYQYSLNGGSNQYFHKYYYDSALQINKYETGIQSLGVLTSADYVRFADGKPKKAVDNQNHKFDRSFKFDKVGRLIEGKAGYAANNDPNLTIQDSPYDQSIAYSSFSEVTNLTGKHWYHVVPSWSISAYPQTKDAAGNVLTERIQNSPTQVDRTYKWDAAGRQAQAVEPPLQSGQGTRTVNTSYDGDGRVVRSEKVIDQQVTDTTFDFRSAVLGRAAIGNFSQYTTATAQEFSVPVNGGKLEYRITASGNSASFKWNAPEGIKAGGKEIDVRGAEVEEINPYDNGTPNYPGFEAPNDYARCAYESLPISCSMKEKFDWWNSVLNTFDTYAVYADGSRRRLSAAEIPAAYASLHGREAQATAETQKPASSPETGSPVQAPSIPDDSGQNDGCSWGDYGPSCYVQSEQWSYEFVDASMQKAQRQVRPTPLAGADRAKWQSERNRLLKMLALTDGGTKSDCRNYLEKIGFNVNQIRENLLKQTPYDAFGSLNDANEDFGMAGITVKQFFDNWKAQGGSFEGGAATGSTGRIYYSHTGITLSVILHETIHASHKGGGERKLYDPKNRMADPTTGVVSFGPGSAAILDSELQGLMNIPKQPDSTNITDELGKNGCK